MHRRDSSWMLMGLIDRTPPVWMAEVYGTLVDLRDIPPTGCGFFKADEFGCKPPRP
jgi:hypothetical protein